jgi:hypothetical protein
MATAMATVTSGRARIGEREPHHSLTRLLSHRVIGSAPVFTLTQSASGHINISLLRARGTESVMVGASRLSVVRSFDVAF